LASYQQLQVTKESVSPTMQQVSVHQNWDQFITQLQCENMMICCAAHLVNIFLIISFIVFLINKMGGTWVILESKKFLPQKFHPLPNYLFEEYIPLSNVGNKLRISKAKPNMSAIHCMVANTCSQCQGSGTQS
jgi:hypothetical protein